VTGAVAHVERAHAWASPSTLHRVMACPASPLLASLMGPEVRDAAGPAAWGERGHEKAEHHLLAWTDIHAEDEHAAVVQPYLDAVRARLGRAPEKSGRILLVEHAVEIAGVDCFGTLDAGIAAVFDQEIDVLDLKTGVVGVSPVENAQLGAYAIGLLRKFAGASPKKWDGWVIRLTTVGARRIDGGLPVDTWTTNGVWCARLLKRIEPAVKASRKPTPLAIAGAHCQYCRAAPKCSAKLAQTASVFPIAAVDDPTGAPPGELVSMPIAPELLSPEALARVLSLEGDIVDWLKACRVYALTNPPPGYKLVAGRKGARDWTSEPEATASIRAAGLHPFAAAPLKSPTAVEKETGREAFATNFAHLTASAPGKPTLAPTSDPRPALIPGAIFPAEALDTP